MEKKAAIISIPQCVAWHTLKKLEENRITCQYEGVDLSGRILMKINYRSDQEKCLQQLIEDMEEGDKSITLLLEFGGLILLNEIIKARTASEQITNRNGTK